MCTVKKADNGEEMTVLDRPRIEDLAQKAAKVAHTVLGLEDE